MLLYFTIELGIFWYRIEHNPKLSAPDQSEKTLGSGPALRFIAAGDSITVGLGASDYQHSYPYLVAQQLAKTNTVLYKNIAVGGSTSRDVLNNQLSSIINYKPDVVVISIGGNDATHLVSANTVLQNYKTIISQLEQSTSAKIYISDIPNFYTQNLLPWFYTDLLELRSKKLNPELLNLTDSRTSVINIHDFGIYQHPKNQTAYAADHFHPNDLGYQNWANAFLNKIQKFKRNLYPFVYV